MYEGVDCNDRNKHKSSFLFAQFQPTYKGVDWNDSNKHKSSFLLA